MPKFNVKKILGDLNVKIEGEHDGYYSICATWRGGNAKATLVDSRNGNWKDLVCGEHGKFSQLISKILGRELTEKEMEDYKVSKDDSICGLAEEKEDKETKQKIYPDNYLILLPNYFYLKRRGISELTCKEFEAGMASGGALYNRVVFPIKNTKNQIVGYNGRDVTNNPNRVKYKIWGNKASNFVYPAFLTETYIKQTRTAVLTESVMDIMRLWDCGVKNTLQLFGLNLSKSLLCYLLKTNPEYIVISTNNDKDGKINRGLEAAKKIKLKLSKYFDENKILIKLPVAKDWCEDKDENLLDFKSYIDVLSSGKIIGGLKQ